MVISFVRQQSFVLLLFAAVALAFVWPDAVGAEQAHWTELAAHLAVALIFFLQGLSLAMRQMLAGALPLRLHFFVLAWNFILFPALAALFCVPAALILGKELGTGLWLMSILPTTIASATALTVAARGGVAQAIFASIFSNLLGVLLVPLLAVAYLSSASGAEFPLLPVFEKLAWIVLLPLVLGQCLRRSFREFSLGISERTRWLPQAAILYIVYLSFAQTVASGVLESLSLPQLLGALLSVTLLLLIASWLVWQTSSWMQFKQGERVSAFFTASQKSIATGLPLLTAIFAAAPFPLDTGLVLVPLLIYHPLQLLLGGVLVPRFAASGQID
jgi:sodium/bile acid cotransporter 7